MIKVLIADDEPRVRRNIKSVINCEEWNFELVGETESEKVALEIAKERKPDIIFLDISMQFLSRLDLIEEFKKVLNDPIIIIISDNDEFNYDKTILRLNVFDYILNPIDRESLKKTISNAKDEIINIRRKKVISEFKVSKL